jgi:crotonobetainyl-CoA:carnitine CoA-transferase CaiB-like acyl-CoA transferase
MAAPELSGLDQDERRRRHDELDERIAQWTCGRSAREAFVACQEDRIPAGPVLHELEALADPHLRARGMFRPNGSDELGTHDYPAHAWHWDGPPLRWGAIPMLGADNEAVFRDLVGLTDREWRALQDDGHVSRDYLSPDGSPL